MGDRETDEIEEKEPPLEWPLLVPVVGVASPDKVKLLLNDC
jgi:hypothetical protein